MEYKIVWLYTNILHTHTQVDIILCMLWIHLHKRTWVDSQTWLKHRCNLTGRNRRVWCSSVTLTNTAITTDRIAATYVVSPKVIFKLKFRETLRPLCINYANILKFCADHDSYFVMRCIKGKDSPTEINITDEMGFTFTRFELKVLLGVFYIATGWLVGAQATLVCTWQSIAIMSS